MKDESMKKTYIILGASSTIGMAYIGLLNRCNEEIVVYACYRTMTEAFEEACRKNTGIKLIPVKLDLSNDAEVDTFIDKVQTDGECVTHILHLAAKPLEYIKIKQWNDQRAKEEMDITYFSFAKICSAFLPDMAKRRSGKVLAVLSSCTLGTPAKFMSSYVASKYALLGFIKAAAIEYADKGLNINAVSPNMMETKFLSAVDERIVQIAAENTAKKRNTTVEETVSAIEYLMSDAASYINGVNMNISGGDYM